MGTFVVYATLLVLLAVAFATWALWRPARKLAIVVAIALPVLAAGLYLREGQPDALDAAKTTAPPSIEDAVAELRARLAAKPDDFEGQALLGRSYLAMQRFDLAREAYAKAHALRPEDGELGAEYAEAMFRASSDHRFPPEAVRLLEAAVAADTGNQRALFLLGVHLQQSDRPAEAVALWEKLLPQLDAETGAALREQIDEARLAAGMPKLAPAAASAPGVEAPGLDIEVSIAPSLAGQVQPGAVLYVFARSQGGGGPPLAVKRIELEQMPMHVRLTDADSPMPAAKLSSQEQVLLVARLSRSGEARAASGDLEASPVQVATDSTSTTRLVLDKAVP